jgi:predicted DNA-binding transcriptional regulator YafY
MIMLDAIQAGRNRLRQGYGGPPKHHATRDALIGRRKLRFRYIDAGGRESERAVRPLGLFFWGRTWTLAAWCEMRNDFRDFRRVRDLQMLDLTFEDEPGRTLRDLLARYGPEALKLMSE